MDPLTIAVPVHEEPRTTSTVTRPSPTERTLAVMATYGLSEDGRKISLLTGGDGRAMQQRLVHVPVNRLHLVSVDADGVARVRLRPRYERDATQQVVRIDAPPTYDTPPDLEGAAAIATEARSSYTQARADHSSPIRLLVGYLRGARDCVDVSVGAQGHIYRCRWPR
jgi:hypothetical protein